jgi:hypothetical protein
MNLYKLNIQTFDLDIDYTHQYTIEKFNDNISDDDNYQLTIHGTKFFNTNKNVYPAINSHLIDIDFDNMKQIKIGNQLYNINYEY